MKLSELMAGYTPSESYAGVANNDDFVHVSYTHLTLPTICSV